MSNGVKTILELENVTMQFGGVVAVDSLSMHVDKGEIVALIGPNGAGKTTAFNVVTGVYAPTNGNVKMRGKIIAQGHPTGKMKKLYAGSHIGEYGKLHSPTRRTRLPKLGVARTFQNIRLFKGMTVLENVLVARHMRMKAGLFSAAFHLNMQEEKRIRQESLDLLYLLGLGDVADEKASSLPYGKQRYLEIARALATEPQPVAAGRARRRHEPAGDGRIKRIYPQNQGRFQADDLPHRAPHESGHGHQRSNLRAGLRPS